MFFVEVESVSKSYFRREGLRRRRTSVVRDVNLTIERGETLGLVGESGSGKSTLARMILGLVPADQGSIRVAGVEVKVGGGEMHALRRRMQPVFQDPAAALDPRMRVVDLVTEPLVIHHVSLDTATDTISLRRRAAELLHSVGMDESALDRYPHQFSGGQKQRINIARALALRPAFLVLDEPVSALDVSVGAQVINLLRALQRDLGLTYLFISHSMPLVRYISTRIAVMEQGKIVETDHAEELCADPREAYTRRLIAATPEIQAIARNT